MLLDSKQNMAPPRKAKNGQRVIGLSIKGAIIFAMSSLTLCCENEEALAAWDFEEERK